MTVRDRPMPAAHPHDPSDPLEDLVVEIGPDGRVEGTSRPTWAGTDLPKPGEPITGALALDGAALFAVLERTRRTGRSERVFGRLLRGGELLPVIGRLTPRPPRARSIEDPGWLLALRREEDVATRILNASPGILIRAVEQMSLGVTLSDRDGRIVYANRAEAEMHGYTREELTGRSVGQLGVPGSGDDLEGETAIQRTQEGLQAAPWIRNRVNRRKDGTVFPVHLISDEIRDEEGALLGRITISEDISERARLERMKEEFIRVVSHELRTPLTSILTSLALLHRNESTSDRNRRAVEIAERNSEHLLELVHDLIDLQTAASGDLEVELAPVALGPLLDEAAGRAAAGRAGHSGTFRGRIEVHSEDEDLRALADRPRLLRVLDHLLANALAFSPAGEPVRLDAASGPDGTAITVTDLGPGIPDVLRRRLFEPFVQADASTTRPRGGASQNLGLGLALSRALVETMGGTIEIAPARPTAPHGTAIRVRLPAA